jgi:hypothetical protein
MRPVAVASVVLITLLALPEAYAQPVTPGPTQVVSASPLEVRGGLGFTSLYYLLNRTAWPDLPRNGHSLRSGASPVALSDPLRIVFIFNAWHLPASAGREDIRVADLQRHLLRPTLTFSPRWPEYTTPGFVALVQKSNHEWVLVARLSAHYLVEDRSGVGVFPVGPQ